MLAALRRHPLLLILAAALVLRVAAAVGVQAHLDQAGRDYLIAGDAEGYWMLAGQIAAGEEYAVYDPPRRVLRMPGFPLLLAGVRAVAEDSFFAARLTLAMVGTAACGAVYLLGAILDERRTGLIAAAIAAFWPALVGFSVLILSETFFALMMTLSLVAMAKLVRRSRSPWPASRGDESEALDEPRGPAGGVSPPQGAAGRVRGRHAPGIRFPRNTMLAWGALVGVSIVGASYVRPTWLPAAGLFPVAYWLWAGRTRPAAIVGLVVVASAIATLAPWTVRNRIVTGHWVPTTLWVGPSLYDGLHAGATGASDMRFFDEERLLDRMSEYDMDRAYRGRAWAFVRENPQRAAELAIIKLWRFWRPWPSADQFSSPIARLAVAGYYLPVLGLAVVGAWVRRRDLWLVALPVAPILLFSLVHCVFVSSLRYRLPAEYPLCVLSAVGVRWLLPRASA